MTAMHGFRPQPEARSTHRIYRDPDPTDTVHCRAIQTEQALVQLATGIDRIELRQAPGSGPIPASITDRLIEGLRAIDLLSESGDPSAERMEREARRRMVDALVRIRVRFNRRLLAGVTRVFRGDSESRVLTLAFVNASVSSCEWHLAL